MRAFIMIEFKYGESCNVQNIIDEFVIVGAKK